jgi:hypothetical protein
MVIPEHEQLVVVEHVLPALALIVHGVVIVHLQYLFVVAEWSS